MGVDIANIVIDPGIGFGKNKIHNLNILRNLSILHSKGVPKLNGLSSILGDNEDTGGAVSYTHLPLPTKRRV